MQRLSLKQTWGWFESVVLLQLFIAMRVNKTINNVIVHPLLQAYLIAFKGADWGSNWVYFEFPPDYELAGDTHYKKSQTNKEKKLLLGKDGHQAKE